ncbi:lachesin-like isoform X3 [Mizuhopecten yessoensis]|uniref:lachesin-like isoform X3 n=1 Tax=Mizuhopecten yessoensis TaxID=6573 RepID=UPI000B4598FF|nr:lachesin-like isoform X3 [Mizuhopecten yessoensis]
MTAECYLELKLLSVAFIGLFLSLLLGFLTSTSAFPEDDSTKIPFFNPRPTNVSYNTGETAVLSCSVMNVDARYVVWRRTSEPNPISFGEYIYSPDPRFNVSRNPRRHEWNLRIRDVQLTDGGVYECAISSRKKYIRHVLLRVYERPTTAKPKGESRHNVKRVSGTSNGGKNHCCITFSSHFARILAVSLTFNYLIQQLAKT